MAQTVDYESRLKAQNTHEKLYINFHFSNCVIKELARAMLENYCGNIGEEIVNSHTCMDMTDPYFMSLDKYYGNYMKIFCKRPMPTDENFQHMPPHEPNPFGTYIGIKFIAFSSIFHMR